jgi:hypothetical protein
MIIGIRQLNFDTEIKTYRYLYGSVFEMSNYEDSGDAGF